MKLLVTISITITKNAINNQIIISNTNYSPFQPLIHSYIYLLLYYILPHRVCKLFSTAFNLSIGNYFLQVNHCAFHRQHQLSSAVNYGFAISCLSAPSRQLTFYVLFARMLLYRTIFNKPCQSNVHFCRKMLQYNVL